MKVLCLNILKTTKLSMENFQVNPISHDLLQTLPKRGGGWGSSSRLLIENLVQNFKFGHLCSTIKVQLQFLKFSPIKALHTYKFLLSFYSKTCL